MRNLDECRAEVFRRSEKRIEKRKKRRRGIALTCVPLVLLAALLVVHRPLPERHQGNMSLGTQTEGMLEDEANSFTLTAVKIDVSGEGVSQSHTDGERLAMIRDVLESGVIQTQSQSRAPESAESNRSDGDTDEPAPDAALSGYVITVTMNDGSVTEYRLEGDTLENRTMGTVYFMPRTQIKELKILLGIPNSTAQ